MIIWWAASDTGWNAECKAFSSGKRFRLESQIFVQCYIK